MTHNRICKCANKRFAGVGISNVRQGMQHAHSAYSLTYLWCSMTHNRICKYANKRFAGVGVLNVRQGMQHAHLAYILIVFHDT